MIAQGLHSAFLTLPLPSQMVCGKVVCLPGMFSSIGTFPSDEDKTLSGSPSGVRGQFREKMVKPPPGGSRRMLVYQGSCGHSMPSPMSFWESF